MADKTEMVVAFRIPKKMLRAADALIPKLEQKSDLRVAGKISRASVLRLALLRGLDVLWEEYGHAK